jgi:hypothetical protein
MILGGCWLSAWSIDGDDEYDEYHPYVGTLWIAGYVFFRNICPGSSSYVSVPLETVGSYSLELYLLQFHLFLARRASQVLLLTSDTNYKLSNGFLCGLFFFVGARECFHATAVLNKAFWKEMPGRNQFYWGITVGMMLLVCALFLRTSNGCQPVWSLFAVPAAIALLKGVCMHLPNNPCSTNSALSFRAPVSMMYGLPNTNKENVHTKADADAASTPIRPQSPVLHVMEVDERGDASNGAKAMCTWTRWHVGTLIAMATYGYSTTTPTPSVSDISDTTREVLPTCTTHNLSYGYESHWIGDTWVPAHGLHFTAGRCQQLLGAKRVQVVGDSLARRLTYTWAQYLASPNGLPFVDNPSTAVDQIHANYSYKTESEIPIVAEAFDFVWSPTLAQVTLQCRSGNLENSENGIVTVAIGAHDAQPYCYNEASNTAKGDFGNLFPANGTGMWDNEYSLANIDTVQIQAAIACLCHLKSMVIWRMAPYSACDTCVCQACTDTSCGSGMSPNALLRAYNSAVKQEISALCPKILIVESDKALANRSLGGEMSPDGVWIGNRLGGDSPFHFNDKGRQVQIQQLLYAIEWGTARDSSC